MSLTALDALGRSPWPSEDVHRLTSLWAEGYSASRIRVMFDGQYSRSAILGKVHRLKLPGRVVAARVYGERIHIRSPKEKARRRELTRAEKAERQRLRAERRAWEAENGVILSYEGERLNLWGIGKIRRAPPLAPTAPREFLNIAFDQLSSETCRFPTTDSTPFLYCGQPIAKGSYCASCHSITHQRAA